MQLKGNDMEYNAKFWKAAANRAIRTMAECALTYIGTATLLTQVHWLGVLSSALMGGVLSVLAAVAFGIPEADRKGAEG